MTDTRTADGFKAGLATLAEADLVVDGLVGIGGSAGLRAPADELAPSAQDVD